MRLPAAVYAYVCIRCPKATKFRANPLPAFCSNRSPLISNQRTLRET